MLIVLTMCVVSLSLKLAQLIAYPLAPSRCRIALTTWYARIVMNRCPLILLSTQ
jgi:hypothetical protein